MNKYVISYSYMDNFYLGTGRYNTLVVGNCIHEAESMTEKEFYKIKKKLSKPWGWNTDRERLYCTGEGMCEVCEHKYECSGSPESEE